jgi:molybdenum cofactor cytidylyltransferase
MKFGRIPVAEAEGGILAHSVKYQDINLKKGTVLSEQQVRLLAAAGCESVVIARLEATDLDENETARRIAVLIAGKNVRPQRPRTGRNNILAESSGLLVYDIGRLDCINMTNEAITLAVLPPYSTVTTGQVVATVKIIPYGVDKASVSGIEKIQSGLPPLLGIKGYNRPDIGFIQTFYPGMKEAVLDKTRNVLDNRLQRLDNRVSSEIRCEHEEGAIAEALEKLLKGGCELILITGASATADRRDVIPVAIETAGGSITHLGMPVEPGNLLALGEFSGGHPVVVMPGCARSPAVNGFDWVLERLLAGIPVTREDIMRMGTGGYMKGSPL